jgi:aryl-alcohol dehydrogenase-like predicted oxidoreductase
MEQRAIGVLRVSAVGLGCNNFGTANDAAQTCEIVDAAFEAGINYFDTADTYAQGKSEEFLGAAIGARRDQAVIATKWGFAAAQQPDGRSGDPALVRASLEESLRRLGTDYVDHYQLHRPDPNTPHAETLGVLAELRDEGKIREIGCSGFGADLIDESCDAAAAAGVAPYASVQNHYSLLTRDVETDGVLDACQRRGLAFVPFFPLELGLLTGKYRLGQPPPEGSRVQRWGERASRYVNDERLATVERLIEYAERHGHSVLTLAMSWLASNPLVATVIAGCTKPEQVRSNAAAVGWKMTPEERAEVGALLDATP